MKIVIYYLFFLCAFLFIQTGSTRLLHPVYAEEEQWYTSDEEFLPLVEKETREGEFINEKFLEKENFVLDARIKGIKIRKEENTMIFEIAAENGNNLEGRDLLYEASSAGFPPRIIVNLYGVGSDDNTFRFFKNIEILGVVSNPFTRSWISEYVIFFEDWVFVSSEYSIDEQKLVITYEFNTPLYRRGYGVRIADTKIDPLPQVIEIKRELTEFGLDNYLLIASDNETVVLESPFYRTKEEAISYLEALATFGFKGKLAIRNYRDFPEPNRFDVVSEAVITGEDDSILRNIVNKEWIPERIYTLSYSEIHTITLGFFSPGVKRDEELIAEYYYELSNIYRDYETEDDEVQQKAYLITVKILELLYYIYPESQRADDALWDMANIIREHGVADILQEDACYRIIVDEYPESTFVEEAKTRLGSMGKTNSGGREIHSWK
ncbi:MAG: hypothetical protein JSV25_06850 [Spirochaetota bacterium]|nr:MAG: hypothetical protein JSV25_06850 [Spirochaetota bacterium]